MNFFLNKKGFTLIELLIVVAIIGILTTVVMANFSQSRAIARDAKRVSDLTQLKLTLEMIYDKCSMYPPNLDSITTVIYTGLCQRWNGSSYVDYTVGDFISVIPTNNGVPYDYGLTDWDKSYLLAKFVPTNYVLRAILETNSNALNDAPSDWYSVAVIRSGKITTQNLDCKCRTAPNGYCVLPI